MRFRRTGVPEDAPPGESPGAPAIEWPPELCFPLVKSDRAGDVSESKMDESFGRVGGSEAPFKCHRGVDIQVRDDAPPSPGRVVAVADGKVLKKGYFYGCKNGKSVSWDKAHEGTMDWSGTQYQMLDANADQAQCEFKSYFVLVNHPSIKMDLLYGEATVIFVNEGDEVKRGQLLGLFTVCGMLHLEAYHESQDPDAKRGTDLPWEGEGHPTCDTTNLPSPLADPRPLVNHILTMPYIEGCHEDGADIAVPPSPQEPSKTCVDPAAPPADGTSGSGDDPLGPVPAEVKKPSGGAL